MPSLTLDRFDGGLDVRRGASVADANKLRGLVNAYINQGRAIQKRPCLRAVVTLEPGTKGLKASGGKLNTFYESGTITHANTLFRANKLAHPTLSQPIIKAHYADTFLGFLYAVVEYADHSVWHHYLDDDGAWAAGTAYAVGTYRRPTTVNGLRYKVTAIAGTGTSGAAEPAWPTTVGATVVDNAGANQITWTCFSTYVQDTNCPQTTGVVKAANKIWAVKGDVVRFCAAGAPRDWTTASNAGFLPVGRYQNGTSDSLALGTLKKQLAVYFIDGVQLWNIDEDPANNALNTNVPGVGTQYPKSVASFSSDSFFLSDIGFRSITVVTTNVDNFQDSDVGSPIDDLVTPSLPTSLDPTAIYVPGLGQYWCFIGNTAWVYTYSKAAKLACWSQYNIGVTVDAATALNNKLYIRSGDKVYELAKGVFSDDGVPVAVAITLPYLDAKEPGNLKQWVGADFVGAGTAQMGFKYEQNDGSKVTEEYAYTGDTSPGTLHPVEVCSTNIAPLITHQADEDFRVDALRLFYNSLGPM